MPRANPSLTVLSTHATDILLDKDGIELRRQEGGPAFFIEAALTDASTPFIMHTGPRFNVEVMLGVAGELGRMKKTTEDQEAPTVMSPYLLVSTVLDEWPLLIPGFSGMQFIDIQGYVRDGSAFGHKRPLEIPDGFAPFCIKGTEEEVRCLPQAFIEEQKQRCLIVTKGAAGADVYLAGEKTALAPTEVVTAKDTLGAGDTFFSYVVAAYLRTSDMIENVREAMEKTSSFLLRTKERKP